MVFFDCFNFCRREENLQHANCQQKKKIMTKKELEEVTTKPTTQQQRSWLGHWPLTTHKYHEIERKIEINVWS